MLGNTGLMDEWQILCKSFGNKANKYIYLKETFSSKSSIDHLGEVGHYL